MATNPLSTPILLLAALLLVLVASLPASPGLRWRSGHLYLVLTLLVAMALVGVAIDFSPLRPDTFASKMRKNVTLGLKEASEPNVLLIDGGSYVLNAVDSGLVTEELKTLGYSVRVMRLAAGGANHFERYRLWQDVRRDWGGAPRKDRRFVMLAEINEVYDKAPLTQFEQNQDTDRVLHYTTPSNAWYAARALGNPGVEEPFEGAWRWPLFRHTLVTGSNAGAGSRLVPDSQIERGWGRVGDTRRPYKKFRGLDPLLKELRRKVDRTPQLPWTKDIRERRLRRLWQPHLSELVYFGVPSTRASQLRYVRAFCRATERKCIAPDDRKLIEALDDRAYWRNAGHMQRPGGQIYSRWLAQRLDQLGVFRK